MSEDNAEWMLNINGKLDFTGVVPDDGVYNNYSAEGINKMPKNLWMSFRSKYGEFIDKDDEESGRLISSRRLKTNNKIKRLVNTPRLFRRISNTL